MYKTQFRVVLQVIRTLTRESLQVFEPDIWRICAEVGVVVALVREMKKVP